MPTCRVAVDDEAKIVGNRQIGYNIQANLVAFGLDDMFVTAVVQFRDGKEADRTTMLLSKLCDDQDHLWLARLCNVETTDMLSKVIVQMQGEVIGYTDADGIFYYEDAPDLRTALGWCIATNGGQVRNLGFFNLDQAANQLLNTIRVNGIDKDAFLGPYYQNLRDIFAEGGTSRFADAYCRAAILLWGIAMRELFR